jgi:hypothetical protein
MPRDYRLSECRICGFQRMANRDTRCKCGGKFVQLVERRNVKKLGDL